MVGARRDSEQGVSLVRGDDIFVMRPMVPSRECDGSVSGDIFVHTTVSSVSSTRV